jgi:hypothetical protein
MSDLHETDVRLWSEQQAELLRRRAANALDWDNLAEEIGDLAISQKREVRSRLEGLCQHLLKWAYQPERRSGSWRGSIIERRERLEDLLEESPSLRALADSMLPRSYERARRRAEAETEIADLPPHCPWSVEQIISYEFWPD